MCLRKNGVKHIKGFLFMSDLYNRIEGLCADSGINITTMCKESGASRASLTDLKMGRKQSLSTDTLSKISVYFGVSVDYLLGNEPKEKAPAESEGRFKEGELIRLDADSMEILRAVRERPDMKILFSVTKNVTPEDLKKAIKIVETFKEDSENM